MLVRNIFSLPDFVFLNSEKTSSPGLQHSGLEQELLSLFFNAYLAAPVHMLYSVPWEVTEPEKTGLECSNLEY